MLWAGERILGTAVAVRTDLCQSDADYRFLPTSMGSNPSFQMGDGALNGHKTPHSVVFESKHFVLCLVHDGGRPPRACQSHTRLLWANM